MRCFPADESMGYPRTSLTGLFGLKDKISCQTPFKRPTAFRKNFQALHFFGFAVFRVFIQDFRKTL